MPFNSLGFWLFFAAVFVLYCVLGRRQQNLLILLASYVFYYSFARGFVLLLVFTTVLDFFCARAIETSPRAGLRRLLLSLSVAGNLCLLLSFKYLVGAANRSGGLAGNGLAETFLAHAVPVGLSFYILQSIGYVVDVYRREQGAHRNFLEYAAFIAFFPQLLAGPVERARHMLPQFARERSVTAEGILAGLWLCFWGLVEKMVISDNLQSRIITPYFQSGSTNGLASAIVLTTCGVRVLYDFAGYSNIARGLARMMGFDLSVNFNLVCYAVSPRDFWRRYHITFFQWMRDYVYRSLRRTLGVYAWLSLLIAFVCSGLWHGLSLNFLVWGVLNGLLIIVCEILRRRIGPVYAASRGIRKELMSQLGMLLTKLILGLGGAFFFADDLGLAWARLRPALDPLEWRLDLAVLNIMLLYFIFNLPRLLVEAIQVRRQSIFAVLELPLPARAGVFLILLFYLVVYGVTNGEGFFYFQF